MNRPSSSASRGLALFTAWLAAAVIAPPAPAQAPESSPAFALPVADSDAGRALAIEARLTGLHLEAFVDGYRPRGAGDFANPIVQSGSPWTPVPPPALWVHSTIYDPIRDRLIVFGGQGYSGSTSDVWTFSLSGIPHWSRLSPSGTPPSPRSFHSAVYDSLQDRMIVFGGNDGAACNDVWALTFAGNATWVRLTPSGTPPAPREWHTAVLDRARNRMIVHGGVDGGARHADVWALSLGATPAWTPIAAGGSGPGGRSSHSALLDVAGDRLVVFAGLDGAGQPTNTVHALSLGATPTWSTLAPTGTAPTPRYGASARYDALRRRAIFFGGGIGAPNTNETWTMSLEGTPAWTLLAAPNPPQGRQFHTSAYDPFGDRLLIFGGSSGPVLSDTWALPLSSPGSAWIPLTSTRRRGHTAVFDVARHRMVVFAGENHVQLTDVWELGLDGVGTWARLNPSGEAPSARALHSAIFDDRRDRMIVFGGRGGPARNDLWELTFSGTLEWRPILAQGTPPPPRFDHVAVYDPERYRVIVFGGMDAGGAFNDVWILSLAGTPTWSAVTLSGSKPLARGGAQGIYDPLRNRLIVHGGYTGNFTPLDDAWQLTLGTTPAWTVLAPSGTKPQARFASAVAYDPTRDRMVISGGTDFVNFFADTWELQFTGAGTQAAWRTLFGAGGPTSRSDHKAVYDSDTDRMLVFGGINPGGILHDTWAMEFASTVDVDDPVPGGGSGLGLALAGANPVRDAAHFAFVLPREQAIELAVYDAAGRRRRTLASGVVGAGRHIATWDGRDGGGERVAAGIYFARLAATGAAAAEGRPVTARVVVLR
jgi:hypothetical protein